MNYNIDSLAELVEDLELRLENACRRIRNLENQGVNDTRFGPITQIGRCLVCGEYHSSQFIQCPRTIVIGATQ